MMKLVHWLVGATLTMLGLMLVAATAYADSPRVTDSGQARNTAIIFVLGLVVVLVAVVSFFALRSMAASRAARRAAEREAEEDRLRSGDDKQ